MKTFMKIVMLILLLNSCSFDYQVIDTKVVRGVISAKDEGRIGRSPSLPKFYVQSAKETIVIDIPFAEENLFKVGDTICVVVKTVKDNTK
jgi:hypothetical protein